MARAEATFGAGRALDHVGKFTFLGQVMTERGGATRGPSLNEHSPPVGRSRDGPARPAGAVTCRQVAEEDLPGLTELLLDGFRRRNRSYWQNALRRLGAHAPPEGQPRFGYLLASGDTIVGSLLLISSPVPGHEESVRCNVAAWFVRPAFRVYAPLLVRRATNDRAVTYVNVSPGKHTHRSIEAQGFTNARWGCFAGMPALSRGPRDIKISGPEQWDAVSGIPEADRRLLGEHADFGCLALWCEGAEGGHPFIFRRRRLAFGGLPCAMLIYCRSLDDLERFAGPIGRYLASKGMPIMLAGAQRPLRGVVGKHFGDKLPIYYKGPFKPESHDLTFTHAALFGM